MCTVSDKLKLCSCKAENVERLKHYWILRRPTEKTHWVVGLMILPADIGKDADKLNQQNILRQLNSRNCFDIELQHQENDILELHFTIKANSRRNQNLLLSHGDFLAYAFKFKKGKWTKDNYNPFEIDFEEVQKGKIVRPFLTSKTDETYGT